MNDSSNSLPKDGLSFGPFRLFAAERQLKKADEPFHSAAVRSTR